MALIKSISGIRGTIGGKPGDGLSPLDVVKFTSAFATFLRQHSDSKQLKVVVGRDARLSGEMVDHIVVGTLCGMGVDVVETGLSTTPTTEMSVTEHHADGGIIITASHNPLHWNALKLLNKHGEFINAEEGNEVLRLAESNEIDYAAVEQLGTVSYDNEAISKHISRIMALPLVDAKAIAQANFRIAIDPVNSTGGIAVPMLLEALGVKNIIKLNCEPDGHFAHTPEPIPQNLTQIAQAVPEHHCDLGIVVDPDVDRLALICENGEMFGEEYTLVAVADYILSHTPGNTVSNLSSSRALRDITNKYGNSQYSAAAVGEVNVVKQMKGTNAIIGGEGNGGVIYPELHSGRDALVGIALFLSLLAKKNTKASELKSTYPQYVITKNRIDLTPDLDVDALLQRLATHYQSQSSCTVTTIDGVKIDFEDGWVHLRKSNTEPIIRIYSEAADEQRANQLAQEVIAMV